MRKCLLCDGEIRWLADYSFEDYGIEGEGIVHRYICRKCGAEVEVSERIEKEGKPTVDDRQMTWNEYESEVKE